MKVIGITGGIGSGKSLVLDYIRRSFAACQVMEADKIAHDLQKPGQVCYDAVVEKFGSGILAGDQSIDRSRLGAIVFSDKEARLWLNQIMHPAVKAEILERLEKYRQSGQYEYVFLEAALLIEEHYDAVCDEMWYIYVQEKIRRERLKSSRGYSDERITQMMESQLGEQEFRRCCRIVIDNNKEEEDTYRQIREVLACQRN